MQEREHVDVVAELSDDDLAATAIQLAEEGSRLLKMADAARFELENRLIQRGATKFDGERFSGVLRSVGFDHTVEDRARLMERLRALLSQTDQDRAFPLPPTPERGIDHRTLNELHKLGGEVAAIIDEERRSTPRRPRLELMEKKDVATEAGA